MRFQKFLITMLISIGFSNVHAQEWPSPEVEQMYTQGMSNLGRGNAQEAIAIFQKTLQAAPDNFLVKRALAKSYQLAGENDNANKVLAPIFGNNSADAECYRISAMAYLGDKKEKDAKKVLQQGLSVFPKSGGLYHELGILYEQQKDNEKALKTWLDGIANDNNYHLNYYEATIAYMNTDDVIWPIIYGEIFINKEPNTQRSNEVRTLLLDAYKKLFFTPSKNVTGDFTDKRAPQTFEDAVKQTFLSLFFVVSDGITTENLTMLRSRFIINWKNNYASHYPFALFNYQENMMQLGQFDAYNQWLFGKAENAQQYNTWVNTFNEDLLSMDKYRIAKPLQIAKEENYNKQLFHKNMFNTKTEKDTKR